MINVNTLTQTQYVDALISFLTPEGIEGFHGGTLYVDTVGRNTIGYGYTFTRVNNVALWQAAQITLTVSQLNLLKQIDAAPTAARVGRTRLQPA